MPGRRLQGNIAVVTGAAQGIGAAIALRFREEGAVVLGLDKLAGSSCHSVDLSDHKALSVFVDRVVRDRLKIDILVNNAAVCPTKPLMECSAHDWRAPFEVNLEGHVALTQLVVEKSMRHTGYGRIVNVASTHAFATAAGSAPYAASKAAIVSLTRSLAIELAPLGIVANCVAPGFVKTPMCMVEGVDETSTDEFLEWYVRRRRIPLARAGEPAEIANVVLFLASSECSYVNGATIVADGGLTITF